nr:hypothetical protein [Steroidobacter cummioxidans]
MGTTIAATVSVSRIAARVSSSLKLSKYISQPLLSAVMNTVASGANSSAARKPSDSRMKTYFTMEEISVSRPGRLAISANISLEGPPAINVPRRPCADGSRLAAG